jgi:hypothetical protein
MSRVAKDIEDANEDLTRTMSGMSAELNYSPVINSAGGPVEINVSGTIRIEGVNDRGDFVAAANYAVNQTMTDLVAQVRRQRRLI